MVRALAALLICGFAVGLPQDICAQHAAFRDCIDCPKVVRLPAGEFIMGSDDERPTFGPAQQSEILRPFAISVSEITFYEFEACGAAGACRADVSDHGWGRGNRPVINVTWQDTVDYAAWLTRKTGHRYRLPTEAEWEYAARGNTTTRYFWGDDPGEDLANCRGCGSAWSGVQSAPVGQFLPNAFGVLDMHGNVSEWVSDCWADRHGGIAGLLPDGSCPLRVTRGGDWYYVAALATSAARKPNAPNLSSYTIGFRVVRDVSE
jgi:formylglycine-generating enzyme required for sulfatase activity